MELVFEFKPQVSTAEVFSKLPHFLAPQLKKEKVVKMPKTMSGVLATEQGNPVGLVLAVHFKAISTFRVVSIFVLPEYRRKAIGKNLLLELEKNLRSEAREILGFYRSHWKNAKIILSLSKSLSCAQPEIYMQIFSGKISSLINIYPGYEKYSIEDYEIVDWGGVDDHKEDQIRKLMKVEKVPSILNPFIAKHSIHPQISSLLVHKGKIVGWFLANKISDATLEYTSLYVSRKCTSIKVALVMMKRVIKKHYEIMPSSKFIAMVRANNRQMTRFVEHMKNKSNEEIKNVIKISKSYF